VLWLTDYFVNTISVDSHGCFCPQMPYRTSYGKVEDENGKSKNSHGYSGSNGKVRSSTTKNIPMLPCTVNLDVERMMSISHWFVLIRKSECLTAFGWQIGLWSRVECELVQSSREVLQSHHMPIRNFPSSIAAEKPCLPRHLT